MSGTMDTKDMEIVVHEEGTPDTHFKTVEFNEFMRVVREALKGGEG